jgi:hypothetical protein
MNIKSLYFLTSLVLFSFKISHAQHSVARQWNDVLLECIRNDNARPTVHSRNLFHISLAMYDAWATYEEVARPYFLGDSLNGYFCPFDGIDFQSALVQDRAAAQEEAISYAAYRLLKHRFQNSPGAAISLPLVDTLFANLGYSTLVTSTNYQSEVPAELGNYIANQVIAFGLQDNSNEQNDYVNTYYTPVNSPLFQNFPGNPNIQYPNNWQPLALDTAVDQSGNPFATNTPEFLSPEWGNTVPFALPDSIMNTYFRNGNTFNVYHDPGMPPLLDTNNVFGTNAEYKWNFALVAIWSSHLDPTDSTMIDISPATLGNTLNYPDSFADYLSFYKTYEGGEGSTGRPMNPVTGMPYTPQLVKRGDYTRVLAEFWADGPHSETPPGHWFTLLNYVSDHPLFQKKWRGSGETLSNLEWDVKSYFTLGGAMHDAAISAWGIKGWYDYIRPVSAIRFMAEQGQCTDSLASNFSNLGIPLYPGYIETVDSGDVLQGPLLENLGKIKIRAWKGPDYITDPLVDFAGVDWILAENWWPYQRPSFVTPPFAGYVSGHSTFSSAAAELMTLITGDPFFPGGMGEFFAPQNNFLVFEEGPSANITLQWATYRDASDECSLSRIWGGIHPPVDDIPGRKSGKIIGTDAVLYAEGYFDANTLTVLADTAICDNDSLNVFGNYVNIAGAYYEYEQTYDGYDSIIIQSLTVNPTYSIALSDLSICANETVLIFNEEQNMAGIYYDTLQSAVGCAIYMNQELFLDSVTEASINSFVTDTICLGVDTVSLPSGFPAGGTYSGTGVASSYFDAALTGTGSFDVVYSFTNNYGCTDEDTTNMVVELCLSTGYEEESFSFHVFPNPNNGKFTISFLGLSGIKAHLRLYNPLSELLFDRMLFLNDPNYVVDISNYSSGIYYMEISIGNKRLIQKIVKY